MFRIADPDATYTHPVTVHVPVGEGRTEPQVYTAKFRLLPASESMPAAEDGDEALVRRVLAGWDGIADVDGAPIEFGIESLARLCDIVHWRRATALAYVEFAAGLPEKKLREAARHLINAPSGAACAVLPANRDAVRVFVGCQTQWRYAGMTGVSTGLDYAGCRAVAAAMGLSWREVFPGLQVMEDEWLSAQAEQRADP